MLAISSIASRETAAGPFGHRLADILQVGEALLLAQLALQRLVVRLFQIAARELRLRIAVDAAERKRHAPVGDPLVHQLVHQPDGRVEIVHRPARRQHRQLRALRQPQRRGVRPAGRVRDQQVDIRRAREHLQPRHALDRNGGLKPVRRAALAPSPSSCAAPRRDRRSARCCRACAASTAKARASVDLPVPPFCPTKETMSPMCLRLPLARFRRGRSRAPLARQRRRLPCPLPGVPPP